MLRSIEVCVPAAAAVVMGVALLGASTVQARTDQDTARFVVRIYDGAAMSAAYTRAAVEEAGAALTAAGLRPEWVHCTSPDPVAAGRCRRPPSEAELMVRILRLENGPRGGSLSADVLGYSLIQEGKAATLATVYLDRVTRLADAAGADAAALLGRAIAHEIGHLLLGTADHTSGDLMRAYWSIDWVRASRPDEWRFAARDAAQMRLGARRRHADGSGPLLLADRTIGR